MSNENKSTMGAAMGGAILPFPRKVLPAPFIHVEDLGPMVHRAPPFVSRLLSRLIARPALVVCVCTYALAGGGAAAAIDGATQGRTGAPSLITSAVFWPAYAGAAIVRAALQ